jgi:hypothetical protein
MTQFETRNVSYKKISPLLFLISLLIDIWGLYETNMGKWSFETTTDSISKPISEHICLDNSRSLIPISPRNASFL